MLTLASLWKFQYFWRLVYKLVQHLWWSFYCENGKPLNIFTKKLHGMCLWFLKTLWTFYLFKVFYIVRLYKNLLFFKVLLLLLIHQTCLFNTIKFHWLEQKGYFYNLDQDPGSGPWTRTLKNLAPEKPGPWRTWTLKNMGNGWIWKDD